MNRRTRKKLRRMIREEINRHLTTEEYDPMNVPATMVGDRMGNILLTFEYNGEPVEAYLQNSQNIEPLLRDAQPDEPGIRDMEDAIDQARSGYSVDIKLYDERARVYAQSMEMYR